jgi:Pyruvate/2-oxoacid:ferredoxin oxidoreductase delta subunit
VNHGMAGTRGGIETGYEGASGGEAARILKKKGYKVKIVDTIGLPENLTVIANPLPQEARDVLFARADKKLLAISSDIASGQSVKAYKVGDWFATAFGELFFTNLGRWQIGKHYVVDPSCSGCGLCARCCPAGAIRMRGGRPVWSLSCDGCLLCFNLCPSKAIQFSPLRLALFLALSVLILILSLNVTAGLATNAGFSGQPWDLLAVVAGVGLFLLLYRAALSAADALLRFLERSAMLAPLLRASHTRRLGRYRAPCFDPGRRKT